MPKTNKSAQSIFYVYVLFDWLGVPRYVGKGHGNRIHGHERKTQSNTLKNEFIEHTWIMLEDLPKVIVREGMTEKEAFETEMAIIITLGRIDINTGPLVNLTDGGDGASGSKLSPAAKAIRGEAVSRGLLNLSKEELSARAYLGASRQTPEQRRAKALKGSKSQTAEQHKARVRKGVESQTPEQLRDRALKGASSQTPEQRRDRSIRAYASRSKDPVKRDNAVKRLNYRTSEERSESTKRWMAAKTPEERSASARKAALNGWAKKKSKAHVQIATIPDLED